MKFLIFPTVIQYEIIKKCDARDLFFLSFSSKTTKNCIRSAKFREVGILFELYTKEREKVFLDFLINGKWLKFEFSELEGEMESQKVEVLVNDGVIFECR